MPVHPVLFHIGPLPVYTYGFMVSLGFVAGYFLAVRLGKEEGVGEDVLVDVFLISLLSAYVGARLLFVVTYPSAFRRDPWEIFRVWHGGLSVLGGAGLALAGIWWYCRRRGIRFGRLLDVLAPATALGYVLARIGCFGNGCCYGRPTGLPWGCLFWNTDPLQPPVPRHPTQLYSAAASLLILLFLLWYRKRRRFKGEVALMYGYAYCLYRFPMEFLRDDVSGERYLFGLTFAQSVILVAVPIMVSLHLRLLRESRASAAGTDGGEEGDED